MDINISEKTKRIIGFIQGLSGITLSEWEEVKLHVDHTSGGLVGEFKREKVLTVNENSFKALRQELLSRNPVDLTYDYPRLP